MGYTNLVQSKLHNVYGRLLSFKTTKGIEDVPEFPDSFSVSDVEILSSVIRMKVINAPCFC
jgi:cystathionine beta-lyase/cystathionine gamma-synthase